jgi:signal transduction histidine kinase
LSIVHSIVVAHDGRLSVHTAPGVGSTFVIRLPLADGRVG